MYKKKCPECGSFTYDESKKIWICGTCGEHIDEIEVEKLNENIEENMAKKYRPNEWDDID